ncbi:hypothetical protein J437_LFUL006070 [Ladona fulva]|uniref:Enoyl-CoA delta isomerase 2, mitochondrial n=1 Tax=Ladona fulva TaxID=123851 RepID=A0A8K0NXE3_LADFU|nr:hypothetical protein J437_LFUL006070 [Ladona fulva]
MNNDRVNSAGQHAVNKDVREITVDVDNGLRVITLNRPKKKNALSTEMYDGLSQALREAAEDENTVITVLTGNGDYYSSGNDLKNAEKFLDFDLNEAASKSSIRVRDFVSDFIEFPKILVAAVNGPAIGIGVTTLALCDVVYASEKATFYTPFSALGISAEGCSTYTFPRIMGVSKASEMLYFNAKMTAHEAERCGLVSKVFPDATFKKEVFSHLQSLLNLPAKSLIYTKHLIRQWDIEALRKANEAECERLKERWSSGDPMNAMVNFLSRRSKL